jgi:translation initiation factor IF-3
VPTVRVVDEEGAQLGVLPTLEALRLAQERGYDLVEVAPMAVPPVVRLLDYGQYKYEAAKKEKEARRHQRSVDFKEIRLKPKIGQGDFDTKVRRAIQFLEDGDRVKVACQFRGRELTHANLGRDLLTKFAEQIKEHGAVERQPLLEGKSMSIVIASTHKPKSQPGATPEGRPAAPAPGEAGPAPEPASSGVAVDDGATTSTSEAPAAVQPVAVAPTDDGRSAAEAVPGAATIETTTEASIAIRRSSTTRAPSSRASTPRPTRTGSPAGGTRPGSAGE